MISKTMNKEALLACLKSLLLQVNTQPEDVDDELLKMVGLAHLRGFEVTCDESMGVVSGVVTIHHDALHSELRLRALYDRTGIIATIE